MLTVPARIRLASRHARSGSDVWMYAESPYRELFATRTASSPTPEAGRSIL